MRGCEIDEDIKRVKGNLVVPLYFVAFDHTVDTQYHKWDTVYLTGIEG